MVTRMVVSGLDFATPRNVPTGGVGSSLAGRFQGAARWLFDMPRRRAVLNELESLSDHELADIGLSRGELPRVFDARR